MTQIPNIRMHDGRTIPQLGFGVWQVSGDDIVDSVTTALKIGYRHIDTAAIYGNEEGVGEAIRKSGVPRDELFVTTKLWNDRHGDARAALTESLERLGLDHVDLYLTHWPTPDKGDFLGAWLQLEDLRREGLTRSIGTSNHTERHLAKILAEGSMVPVVNQIEVHPTFQQRGLVAYTRSQGIHVEAWSPLGAPADPQLPAVVEIADQVGRTPAQVILRWHLQHGSIVFPKSVTPERIASNFEVFDFELSDDQVRAIDALDRGRRMGPDPDTFNG
ncbi:aldo/keto reductase [Mariniluteicoccus endophyticus]